MARIEEQSAYTQNIYKKKQLSTINHQIYSGSVSEVDLKFDAKPEIFLSHFANWKEFWSIVNVIEIAKDNAVSYLSWDFPTLG